MRKITKTLKSAPAFSSLEKIFTIQFSIEEFKDKLNYLFIDDSLLNFLNRLHSLTEELTSVISSVLNEEYQLVDSPLKDALDSENRSARIQIAFTGLKESKSNGYFDTDISYHKVFGNHSHDDKMYNSFIVVGDKLNIFSNLGLKPYKNSILNGLRFSIGLRDYICAMISRRNSENDKFDAREQIEMVKGCISNTENFRIIFSW